MKGDLTWNIFLATSDFSWTQFPFSDGNYMLSGDDLWSYPPEYASRWSSATSPGRNGRTLAHSRRINSGVALFCAESTKQRGETRACPWGLGCATFGGDNFVKDDFIGNHRRETRNSRIYQASSSARQNSHKKNFPKGNPTHGIFFSSRQPPAN